MRKNIILLSSLAVVLFSFTAGISDIKSSGAPIGSTGAPNENTCGKAGCHTGENGTNNINTGKGTLKISHDISELGYEPGKTYNFTVSISEVGIQRFGFSLTTLNNLNENSGTLLVSDSVRTQILKGRFAYENRDYMTYRMLGTMPYSENNGLWTFKWKAPEVAEGKIHFYVAAISANNDASDNGDMVYTYETEVNARPTAIIKSNTTLTSFRVYPSVANSFVNISADNLVNEKFSIAVIDYTGKVLKVFASEELSVIGNTAVLNLSELPDGLFNMIFTSNNYSINKSIYLMN